MVSQFDWPKKRRLSLAPERGVRVSAGPARLEDAQRWSGSFAGENDIDSVEDCVERGFGKMAATLDEQ